MKRIALGFFSFFVASLLFTACQENVYMDWKLMNEKWYAIHKQDTGFVTTNSGLCYRYIFKGQSPTQPKPAGFSSTYGSWVTVNYIGRTVDGHVFDKGTIQDWLNNYIRGWQEMLPKMHKGDSIILYVPSALAYDTATTKVNIPPHSVLIFNIGLYDSMY